MFKHIALAIDGSETSDRAANMAVHLAALHGAQLSAVYVVDPYPFLGVGDVNPVGFQAYMASAQEHAARAHLQVSALCEASNPIVPMTAVLVEDAAAAKGIVQAAVNGGADLIVLGSHGRSGLSRLLLGSTANKVLAEAKIPVLVVR